MGWEARHSSLPLVALLSMATEIYTWLMFATIPSEKLLLWERFRRLRGLPDFPVRPMEPDARHGFMPPMALQWTGAGMST